MFSGLALLLLERLAQFLKQLAHHGIGAEGHKALSHRQNARATNTLTSSARLPRSTPAKSKRPLFRKHMRSFTTASPTGPRSSVHLV